MGTILYKMCFFYLSLSAPEIVPSREDIERYKSLSQKLYDVLEYIGVSKDVRQTVTGTAKLTEVLMSITNLPDARFYVFGSAYEGSSTIYMGSDKDYAHVFSVLPPVVCNTDCISDMSYAWGVLLMLDDKFPGYAKLQLIDDGQIPFKKNKADVYKTTPSGAKIDRDFEVQPDSQNKLCITFNFRAERFGDRVVAQHGPALQINGKADYVVALQSDAWPQVATEWLSRRREYGWPSSDLLQKVKTYGFIVVQAFHPESDEKHLQWRISFSRQERCFVVNFNDVQMKCYVFLKVIKNKINKEIGEETLTSYHCKTCMFYMLETTSNRLWIPEHFVSCLLMCLKQIRSWVMNGNLPNYFIPGENMLDRITNKDLLKPLAEMIENVITSDLEKLIPTLFTVGLGHDIYNSLAEEDKHAMDTKLPQCIRWTYKTSQKLAITNLLANTRNRILVELYSSNMEQFTENIMNLMRMLSRTNTISDHTEAETTAAKSLIMPFLELALLTNTVVKQLSGGNDEARKTLQSSQWDTLEFTGISKLKQAAILLAVCENSASLHTLLKVSEHYWGAFCFCDPRHRVVPNDYTELNITEYLLEKTVVLEEAVLVLFKHKLALCVSFLPTEQLITPLAIKYEMLRAFGVPIEHRNITYYYWFDWGMVDGTFLEVFLGYLNFIALGQTSAARQSVKTMILLLNEGPICHRETCLNLLGWIHMEKGNVGLAVQCFAKSLKERPRYNAACWHFCFLICSE